MKMNQKIKFVLLLALILAAVPVMTAIPARGIDVVVFHSETCGVCVKMMEFLHEASEEYPIVLHLYDIKEEENKNLYDLFKEVYQLDIERYPVPMIFIGKDSFRGYTTARLRLIEEKLKNCFKEGCAISVNADQGRIVIIDPTPTPVLPVAEALIPFLVAAGVFCCLNPLTSDVVSGLKTWKSVFFFFAYFFTSLFLCFTLLNVVAFADTLFPLQMLLVAVAIFLGVLSLVSVKVRILRVPQSFRNAMDKLIADHSGLSLFSLGIGIPLISLVYTCGMYFMVLFRMLFFSFSGQVLYLTIFNVSLLIVLGLLYVAKSKVKGKNIFYVIVGAGSIALGLCFWMV